MSPSFFIDRPIFASVLSIVIVVVGVVSMQVLPVAQYPEITPPVVQIEADYPGASAEVVADAVARPIEVQLPGIDNLLYYDSTSTNDGHMTLRLTFEIGTDIDIAAVQTQNREKLAEPQLPPEVVRRGITVRKVSPDLLGVLTLESSDPRHDALFLANYAIVRVLDNIKRLPGVGDALVFGAQSYSMRLILDPVRMAQLALTPTDIANVVNEQNRDFPAGTVGREPAPKGTELTIPVITRGRMTEERAKALGVPISEIFDTLQAYFGNLYINDFVKFGRVYRVQTEAEAQYRSRPEDIAKIYVRAQNEQSTSMIPLDAVVTTEFTSGPDPVTHFNGYNAALVLGDAAPGYSSGQALDALERAAEETLVPKGYALDWSGISYQERKVGAQSVVAFAFGLLMVFLVLAAQYESWSVPLVVNLAVPFGIFGALSAVWIRGITNDIFFQIGLVTLIGLSAKNAILIVEFVNKRYQAGLPVVDAALEGARLRFRPIIMTSMAFIMGVTPLVLATGAGAAGRHSIGTGVFGGMLAETFLAIFFTPVFFVLNRKLADRLSRRRTEGKGPVPAQPSASGGP